MKRILNYFFPPKPESNSKDYGKHMPYMRKHFARIEDQKKDSLIQWLWNHSRGLKGQITQLKKAI
jgi:hypothetical protein